MSYSYSGWWRVERTWRHVTAFFWHSVSVLVLLSVFQCRLSASPLSALWHVVSLQALADYLSLRHLFYTFVFVAAHQLVLFARMRAFTVALRPTGAWFWRCVECVTALQNVTLLLAFAGSAVLSVWAFTEMSDLGLGLLWPRYASAAAAAKATAGTATHVDSADDLLFVAYGLCAFGAFAGLRSILGHEQVLQFPAAGHGPSHRLRRAKSAFVRTVLASTRTAVYFVAAWTAAYALVLGGRVTGTLPSLLRSTALTTVRALTALTSSEAVAAAASALHATSVAATLASAGSGAAAVAAAAAAAAAAQSWTLWGAVSVYGAASFRLMYWVFVLNVCWQWSRVMCDLFYTEPCAFDAFLLKALVDVRNPYARHMAFVDLQDVAEFSVARRRDIFAPLAAIANAVGSGAGSADDIADRPRSGSDASSGGGAGAGSYFQWPTRAEAQAICRPIVVTTGTNELAIGVSRNGRTGLSSSSSSSSSGSRVVTSLDARVDRVLATPWSLVLESCLSAISGLTDALYAQIGRRAAASKPGGVLTQLFDADAADAYGVFVPSAEQRAEQMFAAVSTVTAAIQSVSLLAVAALTEDVSGLGAQSVGDIVCTLLACSSALDDYTASPNFLSSRVALRLHGQQALRPAVLQTAFHLDNALYRIVASYYEQLSTYILPPQYATRLQAYINFTK